MNVIRDSQYPSGWFLIYTRGSIKKSPLISDISKKILCLCVVQLSLFVYHCRIEPRSFVTWICGAENAKVSSDQKTNAHTRRFFSHTTFFHEKKIQNVGYSCFRWPFYLTDCCQPIRFFMTFTMYKVEHPPIRFPDSGFVKILTVRRVARLRWSYQAHIAYAACSTVTSLAGTSDGLNADYVQKWVVSGENFAANFWFHFFVD